MHPEIYPERVNRLLILPVGFALLVMSISMASACAVADSNVSTDCSPKQASESVVFDTPNSSTTALNRQSQYRYSPSTLGIFGITWISSLLFKAIFGIPPVTHSALRLP